MIDERGAVAMDLTYQVGCHGCSGKGWVVGGTAAPMVCPICKGTGEALPEYRVAKKAAKCPNEGKPCYCTGTCRGESPTDRADFWDHTPKLRENMNNGFLWNGPIETYGTIGKVGSGSTLKMRSTT